MIGVTGTFVLLFQPAYRLGVVLKEKLGTLGRSSVASNVVSPPVQFTAGGRQLWKPLHSRTPVDACRVDGIFLLCYMSQRQTQPAGPPGSSLWGPAVTYLLELFIGGAGVPQEAIGVENAAGIVLVAPEVVAGCKVLSS